ncbi:MAG: tRNA (adenosine(37)-N6)-threonylcarbamoyltransferase complex dimerization subunit type 1 TsaB, partial [Gammaproteobacteria bacterium]|nr:tRNA (adenosine(37)-N6)-threonylcarbamoyltransferase complex dimerization subunit type 1 TsaB [Gammaproteobacteria bacterium]
MNILALDTCTESCSAALLFQGQLFEQSVMTQRGHSDLILGMMDTLFKQAKASLADVDVLAFGRGPGSFTGVRVGVGVAQGIAYARELPVVPVSTLAAVAQDVASSSPTDYIAVAIDARMGEIYCASYQLIDGIVHLLDQERVCPPEQFHPFSDEQWFGVGTGWSEYKEQLTQNFSEHLADTSGEHYPHAINIISLAQHDIAAGRTVSAEQALPVYLRNNVAKKKAE